MTILLISKTDQSSEPLIRSNITLTKPNNNLDLFSGIFAATMDGGIGLNNTLPWNIPNDLKRFKEITTGNIVVMGRKTYESIGTNLPNRQTVVITSNPDDFIPFDKNNNYPIVVSSIDEAIWVSNTIINNSNNKPMRAYFVGGASLIEYAMDNFSVNCITLINKEIKCDTYISNFNERLSKLALESFESISDASYEATYGIFKKNL